MALREADLSMVLGHHYDYSCHLLNRDGDEPIKLLVKHNASKGVLVVEWEYGGRSQWSFNKDCFEKTAEDIAEELVEHVKDAKSYNDLSIRILKYMTPIDDVSPHL